MTQTISADECKSAKGNLTVPMGLITTVRGYLDKTGLTRLFDGFKAKGVRMGALVMMLIVFSLSENNSMAACAEWLKDIRIRRLFGIKEQVSQRTLNRALQKLGSHREEIIVNLHRGLVEMYPEMRRDIDCDGSSVAMHTEGDLSRHGYPRDKNPDGLQVEFMLGMFEESRIPFYVRSFAGNVSDEEQYARSLPEMIGIMDRDDIDAFRHIADRLVGNIRLRNEEREAARKSRVKGKKGRKKKPVTEESDEGRYELLRINRQLGNVSWVIFDNGGASVYNTDAVNEMGREYLTRKDMNKTDMKLVESTEPVLVEPGLRCWTETFESSGRTKYIFKADYLEEAKSHAADRRVNKMAEIARALKNGEIKPESLIEVRKNEFVQFNVKVQIQQILTEYTEEELKALKERYRGKYCGFFHLESSAALTPLEAIRMYRKRVAIEHAIKSLKNLAGIKPMRVWDKESVTGRMVLALLAESIMSMVRYEYPEDYVKVTRKGTSVIKSHKPDNISLCRMLTQLTVTYYVDENRRNRRLISGVSDEVVGILKRLEAKTGRNSSILPFVTT